MERQSAEYLLTTRNVEKKKKVFGQARGKPVGYL